MTTRTEIHEAHRRRHASGAHADRLRPYCPACREAKARIAAAEANPWMPLHTLARIRREAAR